MQGKHEARGKVMQRAWRIAGELQRKNGGKIREHLKMGVAQAWKEENERVVTFKRISTGHYSVENKGKILYIHKESQNKWGCVYMGVTLDRKFRTLKQAKEVISERLKNV